MNDSQVIELQSQVVADASRSALDAAVKEGAQRMLIAALKAESDAYVSRHQEQRDEAGHQLVVRNGSLPERTVLTGAGALQVQQPRVHDKRSGKKFTSNILPPYMRRSASLDNLIPALYLKGVSTGQFGEALEAILGPNAAGLSATTVTRLLKDWQADHQQWAERDLSDKEYVYWWADGIHFNVRLEDDRTCILVLMGTRKDGRKELIGIVDGFRESKLSWLDLLRDLKKRGLKEGPKLAVGDGALGFWAALREEFPEAAEQRCWIHKTANVLNKMPKRIQPRAKQLIHEIYLASKRVEAEAAFDEFIALYEPKYPKATECLAQDRDVLLAFYDFPAEHWQHIRSTNPIESTFATVRHRTRRTKGNATRTATFTMVFQLCREAEKRWRRLNGSQQILKLYIPGIIFVDGEERTQDAA
jgi:transposase-like protein